MFAGSKSVFGAAHSIIIGKIYRSLWKNPVSGLIICVVLESELRIISLHLNQSFYQFNNGC